MNQVVTAPDRVYVVNSHLPNGRYFETFKIEQALPLPKRNRQIERLGNAIEQHLHDLHCKTGLKYSVIYEGNPEMAEAILKQEQECPF